jgi:hypothetical protein
MKGNLHWPLAAPVIAAIIARTTSASAASLQSDLAWTGPVYTSYFNCIHIVRLDETLNRIAARCDTTPYSLMQVNYTYNPNLISSGKPLRDPCRQTTDPTSCVRANLD